MSRHWLCHHEIISIVRDCVLACHDARRFLERAVDDISLLFYDCRGRSRDLCIGAYVRRWRAVSRLFRGGFFNMTDLNIPFVHHVTEVKYIRLMHKMLRPNISSNSDMVGLSSCCFHRSLRSFYLIRVVQTWGRDLDLKVWERTMEFLLSWHNIKLFPVPPVRFGLVYVTTPTFWHDMESPRSFWWLHRYIFPIFRG